MRKLAPLLLVLGLCACGSSTAVTSTQYHLTVVQLPKPKPGRAVFATSGPNAATCDIAFHAPNAGTHAYCIHYPPSEPRNAVSVVMRPSGSFRTCTGAKCIRKLDGASKKLGAIVTVGPYECTVMSDGVLCDISATGRGFLLKGDVVKQVS